MAEEGGALWQAFVQGLEEMRAANSGQMAMEAPAIQPMEAPAMEAAPSYSDMISHQSAMAEVHIEPPDMGMSR